MFVGIYSVWSYDLELNDDLESRALVEITVANSPISPIHEYDYTV